MKTIKCSFNINLLIKVISGIIFISSAHCNQTSCLRTEIHRVVTEDGYILGLQRLVTCEPLERKIKGVAYLVHCFMCNAGAFYRMNPGRIAGSLFDAGIDVWMANVRGTYLSREHVRFSDKQSEYWNFSLHEIGVYDNSANIDYILNITGADKLTFVGHSQGSSSFVVLVSTRPKYNEKIQSAHLLAPILSLRYFPQKHRMVPLWRFISTLAKIFKAKEVPLVPILRELGSTFANVPVIRLIIVQILFQIIGYDPMQLSQNSLSQLFQFVPDAASIMLSYHYLQLIDSEDGQLRRYDYGRAGNLKAYGTSTPPGYALENITCPTFFYYGANDLLNSVRDVEIGMQRMRACNAGSYLVPHALWNHLDFLWAIENFQLLLSELLQDIRDANNFIL